MEIIDNFKEISNHLHRSEYLNSDIIFIQIISRKKDGGTGEVIKSYYIHPNDLILYKARIVELCMFYNARAYIQLNPCVSKKIQWEMIKTLIGYVESNCSKIEGILSSVCGSHYTKLYWIIDIDEKGILPKVHDLVNQCESTYSNKEIIAFPTVSGWHLVTKPFNLHKFYQLLEMEHLDKFEVKRQAMTLLYCDIRNI